MELLVDKDEKYLFNKLKYLLPKKGHFIEIGARDGKDHCYTLCKEKWSGHCIEANPDIAVELKKTYENNNNIKCFNYAITNEDKNVTFYIESNHNSGTSSLYKSRANATDAKLNRHIKKEVTVLGKKLNTFVEEENIKECDLLLTDCEGEDVNILLSTDFSKFKPKYIFSETTFLFYYKSEFKNRRKKTQEVYNMLLAHMEEFNYKLILSNDMIGYKKRFFPDLIGFPMNCCWELQSVEEKEDNKEL